ncbi:MAG: signal peptide peptidase SppA [Pirellulales bacterium]
MRVEFFSSFRWLTSLLAAASLVVVTPSFTRADDEKPAAEEVKADEAKPADETKETKETKKLRFAQFVVNSSLPESPGQSGPFGDLQLDLRTTIARLDKAAGDKSIEGIVLELRNPAIGRGKLNEMREAIKRFRESGKKVHAQMEMGTPGDYLIACACDEIVMPESGYLLLPGVRAEPMFYKGLLGMLGLKADFIHMGDAKGAAEPYTRSKWSKPVKENMTALIDDLYEDMVTTICESRPISREKVVEIINTGLLTAKQAKEAGLIDRLAYPDELRAELAKSHEADNLVYVQNYGKKDVDTDFSGPAGFFKLMGMVMGGEPTKRQTAGDKIAIVYAVGPIMTGKSEQDFFGGETLGSDTIVEALRKADDDERVAAIVLRIDSPGGSAIASDLIWRKMQEIEKPIVASMGDVAASGGYYIAMGADKIYAEPGTITGSIGVVSGKVAMGGLYDKLGISVDVISRGQNSGLFSSMRKFTESERAALLSMMEDVYAQFTTKAAEGRKMPVERLLELASGKVYTGRQAKQNGLIDELGTLHDAVASAKKLAGLPDDKKVQLEVLPEPTNFFESLFGNMDAEQEVRLGAALGRISPEILDAARRAHRLQQLFREPISLVMPFELEIK